MISYPIEKITKKNTHRSSYSSGNSITARGIFTKKQAHVQRGFRNEKFFKKTILDPEHRPSWLVAFRKATKNEDLNGVDAFLDCTFTFQPTSGPRKTVVRTMKIQIKSSVSGLQTFRRKNTHRYQDIYVVVVPSQDDTYPVAERKKDVMEYVNGAYAWYAKYHLKDD